MAAVEQHVEEYVWRYSTEGVSKVEADTNKVAASLDKIVASQDKATASSDRGTAANDRAARMAAVREQADAKRQRQYEQEARVLAQVQAAQDAAALSAGGLTAAQQRAAQSAAAVQAAANDNVQALGKQNSAFQTAGEFAMRHPVLVLAASVAAARALSGLAASAAGSLGAASTATAGYAAASAEMGGAVVAGARVAAGGLGVASVAFKAASAGLGVYAEKMAGFLSSTSLAYAAARALGGGLSLLLPLLGPIGTAFLVFDVARAAMSKAGDDLERLIAIGEKARGLDLTASFVKGFEDLSSKIGTTVDQMDKALQQASGFVKEHYGQANSALSTVSSLYTQGAFGAEKPAAMSALETATTAQEKIRATLDLVKQLDQVGQEFAARDLLEKLFGPEVVDRIAIGKASISQIVDELQSATDKEILKQEQVDRALELNKNISDTKQAISDAVAVTFDFSAAAMAANEAWLKVLQTVLLVINQINAANQASSDFVGTATTTMIDGLKKAGSAAADLAAEYGLIAKKKAEAEVQGPPEVQGPEFKILPKQFPYNFGPTLADMPKPDTGGAKQAKQAAQEAVSSYDSLIQRTKDRIEELDLETRSVGLNTDAVIKLKLAHDLQRAAEKSGIEVTDAMRQKWDQWGTSLAASTDALANAKRGLELTKEAQRELSDDFSTFADDVILGGKKIGQAFADLSKTFASSSLKALLTGQGGLAGLFGTAGEKSGDIGGLLGGKLNLGSLFASSNAADAPLPGAQGPTRASSGLFGDLFDGDKISKALNLGASDGVGKAVTDALKPSKPGGGILSSPLGQGLAAVGAGASVGYSSQSPMMGALSGGLAGLASGDPLLAIAGAGAGAIGSIPSSKKDRRHVARQRLRDLA